ncbi:MAG: hotdog fold domain-containing protein [Pseudonocardiaceae bacterium]
MTYQVLPRDLVTTLFSGAPEFARKPAVLATGILVALCEWPVMDALRQFLGEDQDSLGIGVRLCHQAPVRAGTTLTITACCASVTGRVSRWNVRADDHRQTVARGWTEFAVVRTAVFLQRHRITPATDPTVPHGSYPSYSPRQHNVQDNPQADELPREQPSPSDGSHLAGIPARRAARSRR